MTQTLLVRIAGLKTTPTADLKSQWRELFGKEPPPYSRTYLQGVVRLKPQLVPSVDFHAQEAICSCRQADHPLLNFFAFSHARSLQLGP